MDVALFGEVEGQATLLVVPRTLEVADDVPQEGQGRQDTNLLPSQQHISNVRVSW